MSDHFCNKVPTRSYLGSAEVSAYLTYELPWEGGWTEVPVADGGERHQAPPEGVQEGPGMKEHQAAFYLPSIRGDLRVVSSPASVRIVLLGKVDQAGEGEDGHADQKHQQAQLLVGLHKI